MYQELHRWEDAIAVAAARVRERRGRGGISTTHIVSHLSPPEPPGPQLTEVIPLPVPPGQRPGGEGGGGEGEGGGPGCGRHILHEGRAPGKSCQAHLTAPGEPLEACLKCTVHLMARYSHISLYSLARCYRLSQVALLHRLTLWRGSVTTSLPLHRSYPASQSSCGTLPPPCPRQASTRRRATSTRGPATCSRQWRLTDRGALTAGPLSWPGPLIPHR